MRFPVLLTALLTLGACGPDPMDLAVSAMNRGLVELESGRPGAAVLLFDEAIASAPDWHEAKVNRAVALFHSGDPDFFTSLHDLGDDVRALFLRGVSLKMAGEPESALPLLRKVTERAPEDAHAWCWLGLAARDAGRNEEAKKALSLCRTLRPAQATLRLLGEEISTDGAPIRGRYADWGPLARAVNAFPGVDLPTASGGNRIDLRLEPGSGMGTMEDGGPAKTVSGDPSVVVRAGRRRAESPDASLGDATQVDYVQVRWPSGRITAHGPLPVNETVVIRESNP